MERKIQYRAYIMTKKKDDIKTQEWLAEEAGYALKELDDVVVTSPWPLHKIKITTHRLLNEK